MTKVIFWDLMGTVVRDPFYPDVPGFFGMSLDEILATKHPSRWLDFELGHIDESTLISGFFKDGRPVDGPGLKATMHSGYAYLDGMEDLLAALKQRQVPMYALSNYPKWVDIIEAKLKLSRFMGLQFISYRMGVRKPDSEAYLTPCRALEVPAQDCMFVDDRLENVEAAASLGMRAVHFRNDASALNSAVIQWLDKPGKN